MLLSRANRQFLLLGMATLTIVFALNQLRLTDYFPIKSVHVFGANRVDQKSIQETLIPLLNHGFFGINVELIRERLLQQPWVSDIFVRRNWPDQVEIAIVEKHAIAEWNEQTLLSDLGELFIPSKETYPENLPQVVGPNGKQMVMLRYFKEINRLLMPLHAKISYLELTPYLTLKLRLDNGITMQLGHKDILTRLGHFVKVYPKIVGDKAASIDTIDLRYPNGVAVAWKSPFITGKKNYGKEANE
jgi:cell division protein FtsQ